jgi:hypothetical protein
MFVGFVQKISQAPRGDMIVQGEWKVESGEWRVDNGEWIIENGEWRMENYGVNLDR